MSIKIYEYSKCSTCRQALKHLDSLGVKYTKVAIRETPPSIAELQFMLKQTGDIKRLFNTSGQDYRQLNIKDKIKTLSEAELLKLLNSNGNLVKRPFILSDKSGTTGFKIEEIDKIISEAKK